MHARHEGCRRRQQPRAGLSVSLHRSMPKDLDEPIIKHRILRLPRSVCVLGLGKAHERLGVDRIDGDVGDGAESLEPIVDVLEGKFVLGYLLHDERGTRMSLWTEVVNFAGKSSASASAMRTTASVGSAAGGHGHFHWPRHINIHVHSHRRKSIHSTHCHCKHVLIMQVRYRSSGSRLLL